MGGSRPKLATMTTAAAAANTSNNGGCSGTPAHGRPPRASHTQDTCASRPHLASLTTAAAAANTSNGAGCRATPTQQPRNACAAAAPVSTRAAAALVTRHRQPWPPRPEMSKEQAWRPPLDMSQTSAAAAT